MAHGRTKPQPSTAGARAARAPSLARAWLLTAAVLLPALYALAPHRVTDADALSRLAMGRLLWNQPRLPAHDPFTYGNPQAHFGDPEWLGDLVLSAIHDRAGEAGLTAYALALGTLGYTLALGLGIRWGASPPLVLALLLCTLPAAAPRIGPRNDLHLLWIVPAFAWLAGETRTRRAAFYPLLALGWLWANLHSSFVLGSGLLLATLLDLERERRRDFLPWCVLLVYPALPWLGLSGSSSYRQLLDHASGAAVYTGLISEWQSPLRSPGMLAILPLHLLLVLGTAALVAARPRPRALHGALFFGAALACYGSRRFLPLMAACMVPASTPYVTALATRIAGPVRRALSIGAGACVALYVGLALRSVAHRSVTSVFGDPHSPERAARFMRAHAPRGARVLNAFNDGPWLLWWSAPAIRHYLDPRNNLGAATLARYVDDVLVDARHFEAERARLNIGLVLLRAADPQTRRLREQLAADPNYPLVYWDGFHALLARVQADNRTLIERHAYRVLRPRLDFRYLDGRPPHDPALDHDLARLAREAPPLARALRGYRLLQHGDRSAALQAAKQFQAAVPELPRSAALLSYWAQSLQRAGFKLAPSEAP